MDHLKQRFEKDLKAKLLLKSSGHVKEDLLLLKSFKYCDSNDTGKCDQDTFAQALSKVGSMDTPIPNLINYSLYIVMVNKFWIIKTLLVFYLTIHL